MDGSSGIYFYQKFKGVNLDLTSIVYNEYTQDMEWNETKIRWPHFGRTK